MSHARFRRIVIGVIAGIVIWVVIYRVFIVRVV